uniref:Uncharacterized protein n=1 Tax=Homalodisca liturata TaxID=320908 RepID=A0A1B6IZH1_9HEMI
MYDLLECSINQAMETESVKSALSEQSSRSKRSRSHGHRSSHRSHSHRSNRTSKSQRKGEIMAPFQTAVTLADDNRDGQEVIEVQILPQVTYCWRLPMSGMKIGVKIRQQ